MEATDTTIEQAAESLIAPEPEAQEAEEIQSEEAEVETEDAPVEEQTDEEEAEADEDDAEIAGEESDYEDEDETDDAETEEPTDSHIVKVDGEERAVTLDELKRSYSGQAYIQKGMKEVSDLRKQVEGEASQISQQRAMLNHLVQSAQQGGLTPPTPPDPEKFKTDPIGFMEEKIAFDQANADYQHNLQIWQQNQQQQAEQERQQYMAFLQEQAEILKREIPEFADPDAGGKLRENLRKTGTTYGFSEDEVAAVTDARMVKVLNDAMKWRNLQASKKDVEAKAKKARPVVKPGAKKASNPKQAARKQLREQFNKTGSLEDAAALLLDP